MECELEGEDLSRGAQSLGSGWKQAEASLWGLCRKPGCPPPSKNFRSFLVQIESLKIVENNVITIVSID